MGKKNKKGGGGIDATRLALGGYDREMERFGIKGVTGGGRALEMQGLSGGDYRDEKDVEKDMVEAARNDYDLRRTLEAASFNKSKAKKILDKGFKNAGDITNALNFSEKAAKRHGQGGDFSSASDYMGLTQSMVERDRRIFNEDIDARIADAAANQTEADAGPEDLGGTPITYDAEASAAKERVEAYDKEQRSGGDGSYGGVGSPSSVYNVDYEDEQTSTSVTPDSHDDAQSYMQAYVNKIKNRTN